MKRIDELRRERDKIHRNLEGIRNMENLPGAVFIVDPRREKIAVAEAKRMHIPTICLADTDCDPDNADIIIPGNDDAMRAVELVTRYIADAVLEGQNRRRDQGKVQPLPARPRQTPAAASESVAGETPAQPSAEAQPAAPEAASGEAQPPAQA